MQDMYVYEKDNTYTAFLAGASGALIEMFEGMIPSRAFMQGNYIESDVFYLGENNEISIENAVKTRFRNFWYVDTPLTKKQMNSIIDSFSPKLNKIDDTFEELMRSIVISLMEQGYRDTIDDYNKLIHEYCSEITYCLGKIRNIYHQDRSGDDHYDLLYSNFGPLVWDVFFIEFDEYALMLMPTNSE